MPVPAIGAQSLERDHRSAGEYLKSSTKEFQPVSQLHRGPNLNASVQTHIAWGTNEELETCAHLQGYDLIGIMETWWDGSYDWSVGMEGYRLFRKDRQGRQGGGITLYVNDQLECMELCLGMDEEPTESL